MSEPFMGEIKIVSFNFPPRTWALCNGQFLPINQNQALFSLLGTMYGGNGQTTFALPDFRGRAPVHQGSSFIVGEKGGQEAVTISQSTMPAHNHFVQASTQDANSPFVEVASPASNNVFATVAGGVYGPPTNLTTMYPATLSNVGGSQPHDNRQPSLVLNFVIALSGIFPTQN